MDAPSIPTIKYEFLDHTADVQLHAWGSDVKEAFEQVITALYAYTILEAEKIECSYSMDFEASGSDLPSLLYNILDECLYNFNSEPFFIGRVVQVLILDEQSFKIKIRCWGESFSLEKHPPGTEIKAITYSNLQINSRPPSKKTDIFVVVDI